MTITALPTPAPSRTQSQDVFDSAVDAFVGALPTLVSEMNVDIATTNGNVATVAANTSAAAASATAAASSAVSAATSAANAALYGNASLWVSGTTYALGVAVVSPANSRLYKRVVAGAGTTDPSADATNWTLVFNDSGFTDIRLKAVLATLPSLSYVDACFHLAKADTDKGAWRKIKGQSWRDPAKETTWASGKYWGAFTSFADAQAAGLPAGTADYYFNTTGAQFRNGNNTAIARAGREDYPTNAMLTLHTVAGVNWLIIWDLDTAIPSMWKHMIGGANTIMGTGTVSSIAAKNQHIIFGVSTAASRIDMLSDASFVKHSATDLRRTNTVASSNVAGTTYAVGTNYIVNSDVRDVAITILPDAATDEFGMPLPTFAVATAGGISAWTLGGAVWDITYGGAAHSKVAFDKNNRIVASLTATSPAYTIAIPTADNTANPPTGANVFDQTAAPACFNVAAKVVATGDNIIALGSSSGLELLVDNVGTKAAGIRAAVTSTYNTGGLVGDIRRCFLANSTTADRSVKAGLLTVVGAPTETVVTGGRNYYTGFSAANYFQEASHADWNALGTGDFSIIMSGVTWGTASTTRYMMTIGNGTSAGSVYLAVLASNAIVFSIHNGTAFVSASTTAAVTDTAEHVIEVKRIGATLSILIDGVIAASATGGNAALTISNATGFLRIGEAQHSTGPHSGRISCVRISATAPTAEQSKLIAATENALNGGNACLLSNADAVSALSYDNDTKAWMVGNGTNVDTFSGLKRIASQAHGVTTLTSLASANGRTLIAGTGATYSAPERNVSAELMEAMHREPRTQQYSFTTPAATTTRALPLGWKAQGIAFNTTDSTFLGTYTQSFDGFIWTMAGLTASKAYQINLVEVI